MNEFTIRDSENLRDLCSIRQQFASHAFPNLFTIFHDSFSQPISLDFLKHFSRKLNLLNAMSILFGSNRVTS